MMSFTGFEAECSYSGRLLYIQVWYILLYMLNYNKGLLKISKYKIFELFNISIRT